MSTDLVCNVASVCLALILHVMRLAVVRLNDNLVINVVSVCFYEHESCVGSLIFHENFMLNLINTF